ncbi:MAG: class I SAM-dependent rRNA methyltransferase [Gammaproteobacteria bacterium]|nr:class I SAM-dependent rRNA methyltransferase [Gammaproteobacteria bacterium]
MSLPALILKKGEDRRLRAGHLWVFSNEVDVKKTPLTEFKPGDLVQVQASGGKPLGMAYVNPHSLISARLLTHGGATPEFEPWLTRRVRQAAKLRETFYEQPYYRLIFGESDGLPGLVVDRYGDTLVVQITTAGMEARRDDIIRTLQAEIAPKGIVMQNHVPMRELEGLPVGDREVIGEADETLRVIENGLTFEVNRDAGQKTGYFYDQRDNRGRLGRYVKGKRVLDVFSYVGAWGVTAAANGAADVTCVDSSASALEMAKHNAALNDVSINTIQGDAFEVLADLREKREKFDVVIIDPPAFIKRRKDYKSGLAGYQKLNQMALQVLEADGGILVSASCSHHLPERELAKIIQRASRHVDRYAQILEWGQQAVDHPEHPAIPETRYLKACFTRILPGD